MNRNNKIGMVIAGVAAISITASAYLYWESSTPDTPFWTTLENDERTVAVSQGETKTIPVELHYWKGLRTLLGIEFEEPEPEHGGLYNPPDGLAISFDMDGAFVEVSNGEIVDILSHRDVKLKEPSEVEQRLSGDGQMVVAEVGTISISVSDNVPVGSYNFGLATTDAQINSKYGGNSQELAIEVVE